MAKLVLIATAAIALYLASIIIFALLTANNPTLYMDDVQITVDGKTLYIENFTETTSLNIDETGMRAYSQKEYVSPPNSLAIIRPGSHGIILEINAVVPDDWRDLKISFMSKLTGVPPSAFDLNMWFGNSIRGSYASLHMGEKDVLSGRCLWSVYDTWVDDSYPYYNISFEGKGDVVLDWSSWHRVDLSFNQPESKFVYAVDSNVVSVLEFGSYSGSNLKVMWSR
jgi:hypothetical protein